jgi:nucleoside phosphorylase
MSNDEINRVVMLTAIKVEFEAVRCHVDNPHWDRSGTVPYLQGSFSTANQKWNVLIRETGSGNIPAGLETFLAIQHFQPMLLLFVGIAGGLKDVSIGDLVIPTKAYAYESGKANMHAFQTRPEMSSPTFHLVQLAQIEAKGQDWWQRIKEVNLNAAPNVFTAPIASGGSVVASTESDTYKLLSNSYSDALAVDMETYGFFYACRFYHHIDALAIRGISDLIDNKDHTDKNNAPKLAACHASAFAFELLAKMDMQNLSQKKYAKTFFVTASQVNIHIPPKDFLQTLYYIRCSLEEVHKYEHNFYDIYKFITKLIKYLEVSIDKYYHQKVNSHHITFTLINLQNQMKDFMNFLNRSLHTHLSGKPRRSLLSLKNEIYFRLASLIEKLKALENLENIEQARQIEDLASQESLRAGREKL